jgi:acetylglutamate kinase
MGLDIHGVGLEVHETSISHRVRVKFNLAGRITTFEALHVKRMAFDHPG